MLIRIIEIEGIIVLAFSFIHISDIHLGRAFSDLSEFALDANTLPIINNAVEVAFNNFINFAIQKDVDFVLISGDTFDSKEQDFSSKLILKDGLKKLNNYGIKVFIICGNHDPIDAFNKNTFNFSETSNIKIIGVNTNQYENLIVTDKNNNQTAEIHAYSFNKNHIDENPLQYFSHPQNPNLFNIGLLHCDLNADKSSPYVPVSVGQLKEFNYNYWALGHIHVPYSEDNIQYPGTIQGRNTKETGGHGFRFIEVENNKIVNNSFISSDVVRFDNIEIDLSQTLDTTSAYDTISEKIKDSLNTEMNGIFKLLLLKVSLIGRVNYYSDINQNFFETISEKVRDNTNNFVYISEVINNTIPEFSPENLNSDDGISGEVYRCISQNNIDNAILSAEDEFKNIIKQCYFDDNEISEMNKIIAQSVNNKCLDIANCVYYNEMRDEECQN